MARIQPLTVETASSEGAQVLEAIKSKIGMVPNLYASVSHSPAALKGLLAFGDALDTASISAAQREQLALAIAGANSCDYCASAHTLIGKGAGVNQSELEKNLSGESDDPQTQALITLATKVVRDRGNLSDQDLADARGAGLTEAQIVEVIAVVALNTFTNYFNHIAQTEIDFPVVSTAGVVS
jgi:uncharacterized peroxidase-related enzyme